MNTEEKLLKLRKLADAMYYAAQQLTTDASRLHKTMEEYHQFIMNEYHKEEPVRIKRGCKYRCLSDMQNTDTGAISFFKDKIYSAPEDNTLVSEENGWLCDISENSSNFELVEEPVSEIDFEQELYKYFGQVKDFTLGMRIAKRFYEIGRNHQESVSEDLEKELSRLLKDCEIDSEYIHQDFLHIVANHFADWQKEQMMAKAVDVTIAIPYQNGDGGYSQIVDSKEALPFGEKVKVIVIKED